jgi:hypothetical protein
MGLEHVSTAADAEALTAALPPAPAGTEWRRTDSAGGIVEYRLPDETGPCTAAKLTVRPDPLSAAAVRVDRTQGCSSAGTTRHETVEDAAATVRRELDANEHTNA